MWHDMHGTLSVWVCGLLRESVFNGGGDGGHFQVFVDAGLGGGIAVYGETTMELVEQGERERERGGGLSEMKGKLKP